MIFPHHYLAFNKVSISSIIVILLTATVIEITRNAGTSTLVLIQ